MSTSGNTIKLLTRDDIINAALRKLVVISEGASPTTNQVTTAAEALNIIVAEFRTLGMSVWARSQYNLVLVSGQNSYTFGIGQTLNLPYPMYIYTINYVPGPNFDTQVEMTQMPIVDFSKLPRASTGIPVNYTYQPTINQGTLSVWPKPDSTVPANSYLQIIYQRPIEVFDAAGDNPDFPQEWGNALIYNLALSLSDEYGVAADKQARIEKSAANHLATAISNSTEQGSLFFQPDYRKFYDRY